ncbi:hypothetical protein AAIR98_001542 [Elusimicrobium simillimum]|uniref:hypothetical protein n=1 Tax=Elusimicrobium simillimum TaxID=3143438 RepID=UPI003C703FAF
MRNIIAKTVTAVAATLVAASVFAGNVETAFERAASGAAFGDILSSINIATAKNDKGQTLFHVAKNRGTAEALTAAYLKQEEKNVRIHYAGYQDRAPANSTVTSDAYRNYKKFLTTTKDTQSKVTAFERAIADGRVDVALFLAEKEAAPLNTAAKLADRLANPNPAIPAYHALLNAYRAEAGNKNHSALIVKHTQIKDIFVSVEKAHAQANEKVKYNIFAGLEVAQINVARAGK